MREAGDEPPDRRDAAVGRPKLGRARRRESPEPDRAGLDLSIVLATRDRAHRLETTLERVARMRSRHEWELVVVDNGSTDDTPAVVREFAVRAPMPVVQVDEPRAGLGRARNAGVRASSGALVAVTDDDCYPREDYVDAVV